MKPLDYSGPVAPSRRARSGGTKRPRPAIVKEMARAAGLVLVDQSALRLTRRKAGRGYCYFDASGTLITDEPTRARLASLAVPPAHTQVRYAENPRAHLQAVGYDAAGRLQYRYHPRWELVRERCKAERLARFAEALSTIRRAVARDLGSPPGSRTFALSAVVELVTLTAIRAGEEGYARARGTRGAATLLKSNLRSEEGLLILSFRAKGGRRTVCQISDPRFIAIVSSLSALPGRRLFQYRDDAGAVRTVRAGDVNAYLKKVAGVPVSLKDFRTLVASASVLDILARAEPASSARARNAQVVAAIRAAAETLNNTPAICRKSYVMPAVVAAFEDGTLSRFAATLKRCRSPIRRAGILAELIRESCGAGASVTLKDAPRASP